MFLQSLLPLLPFEAINVSLVNILCKPQKCLHSAVKVLSPKLTLQCYAGHEGNCLPCVADDNGRQRFTISFFPFLYLLPSYSTRSCAPLLTLTGPKHEGGEM